ncbi:MAG: hypothetical protein GF309_03615 [Candidatus Lokiarchaeota archaeon]|nr:hypothetical protein [Candidatus Lokiarchaeota archaeon]
MHRRTKKHGSCCNHQGVMKMQRIRILASYLVLLLMIGQVGQVSTSGRVSNFGLPTQTTESPANGASKNLVQVALIERTRPQNLFDFNNDGTLEILGFCEGNDTITILRYEETTLQVVGSIDTSLNDIRELAAGNVDGDPAYEIVVAKDFNIDMERTIEIYEVEADFSMTHEHTIAPPGGSSGNGHLAVGDTDGDNVDEVLFTQAVSDHGMHGIIDYEEGSFVVEFSLEHGSGYGMVATTSDLDQNGVHEAFFGFGYASAKNGDVDIYNYSEGTYQLIQTLNLGRDPEFSPQTGDSNNDGIIDLPMGSNVAFSKYLRILQFNGVDYEFVEDGPNNGDTWVQPTVGDLDGDGYDESVYGHEISNPNPNALDVYQVTSGNFELETTIGPETGYEYFWRPRIGDITGDGIDDLVFTGETSTTVDTFAYAINSTSPNQPPTSPHFIDMPNSTTENSLNVEWNESTDSDGIVRAYELQMDDSSSFPTPQVFETEKTTHRISKLENGTYYFRVRSVDDEGMVSIWSDRHITVVGIPADAVPPALTITHKEDIYTIPNATIAWNEPKVSPGWSVDYEAELAENSNFTLNREKHYSSGTNITLRYLTEGTYYFKVRARVNGSIYGPWSETESFFVYLSGITIVGPEDFFILDTTTNTSVSWTVISEYMFNYNIYVDTLLAESSDNKLSNITFLLPKLAIGQHNITLEITDLAGCKFVDSVQVRVVQNVGGVTISLAFYGGIIFVIAVICMYMSKLRRKGKWENLFVSSALGIASISRSRLLG